MRALFALMFLFAFGLQADSIKRADKPRDTTIKVIVDGTEYCYSPVFTNNEGYVYITYCSYVKPARYDVFERIGFASLHQAK